MIACYKTSPEGTFPLEAPEPGCWVSIVAPTFEERAWLRDELGVLPEFVQSVLDDEESSHVDFDDDAHQTLIIIDCPFIEDAHEAEDASIVQYDTHPLSILFLQKRDILVTVSLKPNDTIRALETGRIKQVNTKHSTRLILKIMLNIMQRYLGYLRNIDRQFNSTERVLRETMRNAELIKMLALEKSLVYFSTSLKGAESTLAKISSGRYIRLYEDDRDLLDDVLIEMRQAIEMCTIYTSILNGTMDTFSSVINNNLNFTMRTLTTITLLLAVPTIIFSFYGMNVPDLPIVGSWYLPIGLSVLVCVLLGIFFKKSRFFK